MEDALGKLSRFTRGTLLPLCRDHFADPVHGGFHERLDADLTPVATGRKRLMVQARQRYVLSHAAVLGDRSGAAAADQGYAFLLRTYRDRSQGGWLFAATAEGEILDGSKNLYGHAFLLFALAWLHTAFAAPDALDLGAETMDVLKARLALPGAGFHASTKRDWTPTPGPLLQNPHMHLLEALLALHDASGGKPRWMEEADALVRLFQEHLFHRPTGTLREVFTDGWAPDPARGVIVEPGHQFEWVWLLDRYRRQGGTIDVAEEIGTLFRFAMSHGFDGDYGGIHDQVAPDGTPLLRTRRIWPVAEALKAVVVMEAGQAMPADADRLADHLLRHFVPTDRMGWHETLTRDGVPTMTDLPGSTPYHLFMATIEAERGT